MRCSCRSTALCAEQSLKGYLGRQWTLGEAAYLAFKGPKRVVGLFCVAGRRGEGLAEAQQRLADTVDAIDAGHFPPTPGRCVSLRDVHVRGRLPEGLRR